MSSTRERLRVFSGSSRGELMLFTWKVTIVLAFALALLVLWQVRQVLILIVIAAVIAAGIAPAVRRLQLLSRFYLRKRMPRGTAVLIVYFPFLFLITILAVLTEPCGVRTSHPEPALSICTAGVCS